MIRKNFHFKNSGIKKNTKIKIYALIAGIVIITTPALERVVFAAENTTSSWSNSPQKSNWKTTSKFQPAQQSEITYKESRRNISPFAPGSHNVALELGQAFLMGDLGSHYSDSIRYQLHYTYGVSDIFGFDSSLGYSDHSDGALSMTSLTTGLRTNLAWFDKIVPYATFGLGFYKPSRKVTPTSSISPLLFGIHLGPGVSLQLTNKLFFGSAITFHDIFGTTKDTSAGTIDVGGSYTTFLLHTGVTF